MYFSADIADLCGIGLNYKERSAPDAMNKFKEVIALCEKRGEYPYHYKIALIELIKFYSGPSDKLKAAYFKEKLAKYQEEYE